MALEPLSTRIRAGDAVVAGVLSGTSADGIDVGLARVRCRGEPPRLHALEPLAFSIEPFTPELGARVRAVLDGEPLGLRATALLDRDLGRAFGHAARTVAERAGLALDLVGSHGQTVWHHDGVEPSGPASLQLGDGDFVAEAAGCTVVSDFRQRDLAAGGEGAPISVLADDVVFASAARPIAILNLGGMANLSVLAEERVLAFDTGPAGSLLDALARRLLGANWDEGGGTAARGTPVPALVDEILAHPFFERSPPKSTGRDTFGGEWVRDLVARAEALGVLEGGTGVADLLASAVHSVAAGVADALARFGPPGLRELVVAGGGARNRALLGALRDAVPARVESSAHHGVDPDAREAFVFAVLAARCTLGEGVTRAGATGAAAGRPLGKISPPQRG